MGIEDPFDALPPWEAIPYFDAPTETQIIALPFTGQVVGADNQRVILGFSSPGLGAGSTIVLSTSPLAGALQGLVLNTTLQWILLRAADYGPLVWGAWFTTNMSTALTVIEVRLNRWPTRRNIRARRRQDGTGGLQQ